MNILFNVDQQATLRAGIDAPSPTTRLDVSPAELTQEERNVLAAVFWDNSATKTGVSWYEGTAITDAHGVRLRLVSPDMDGVHRAIATALAEAKTRERRAAASAQETDDCDLDFRIPIQQCQDT